MAIEQTHGLEALRAVKDPDLHKDIVKLGFVKDLAIDGGAVTFTIELTTPARPVKAQMKEQARVAVMTLPGVASVDITMTAQVRAAVSPDLTGTVKGEAIQFVVAANVQGNAIELSFVGTIESKDAMKGKVSFAGIGEGTFTGKRKPS